MNFELEFVQCVLGKWTSYRQLFWIIFQLSIIYGATGAIAEIGACKNWNFLFKFSLTTFLIHTVCDMSMWRILVSYFWIRPNPIDFSFTGNQRFSGEFEIHLVSRIRDLWSGTVRQAKSSKRNVRSPDPEESDDPLRTGVS
jgi:hypothetical protein